MAETEQEPAVAEPIGTRLKTAREALGLSLDDIAAKTRVPIRHLQHVEREEWDELPATTYSIGFARAYANAVGLNGAEIGTQLRAQIGTSRTVAMPNYEPADPARVPPRALAIVAAIIALLLAGGYFMWRGAAVDDAAVDEAVIGIEEPAAVTGPAAAPDSTPAPSASAATGPVVLTATSDVWLRVYDGNGGPKLYENTLRAGERYTVPPTAQRPMIVTGRPDVLRVTVGAREIPALGPPNRTISDVSLLPADLLARGTPVQGTTAPVPGPAQPLP
jgi:transcriptional regulator with XRE-family HTH domain